MRRLPFWLRHVEQLRPAPWKRPALLALSTVILIGCYGATILLPRMPTGFWVVIGSFAVVGVIGLAVGIFGSDRAVAIVLGSI